MSVSYGESSSEGIKSMVIDPRNDIIVCGEFYNSFNMGAVFLNINDAPDLFLAKLDGQTLDVKWARSMTGSSEDFINDMAGAPDGTVVVTGDFQGNLMFESAPLVTTGITDTFVAAFSQNGNTLWAKSYGDLSTDAGLGVACDQANGVAVTGTFRLNANFNGEGFSSVNETKDIFVLKMRR
jgi:hypothetical protein